MKLRLNALQERPRALIPLSLWTGQTGALLVLHLTNSAAVGGSSGLSESWIFFFSISAASLIRHTGNG